MAHGEEDGDILYHPAGTHFPGLLIRRLLSGIQELKSVEHIDQQMLPRCLLHKQTDLYLNP